MAHARSTREIESRAHEELETYDVDYLNPLEVPPGVAKEGYDYHWARKDIRGEDDYRIERLIAQKWTPVPAERSTVFVYDPLGRNPLSKKFICTKDLLLMERPSIYSIKQTERFFAENANKIKSLRGVSNDMGSFDQRRTPINSF